MPRAARTTLARLMGQSLSEQLGRQFVIENRPGAGSNLATEKVVHAPPDGYTLLSVNTSNAINSTLYDKLNFNFIDDIAPVAGISRASQVMVVNPSLPVKTVAEFITYEAITFHGIGAPKGTPADTIDRLNKETNSGLADSKLKTRLAELGGVPMPMTPADFRKFIADETEKWAKVIRTANIKPE